LNVTTEKEVNVDKNQCVGGEGAESAVSLGGAVEGLQLEDVVLEPASGAEQLQAELEQSQAELADAKDQMMRALADAQNARRRAEKDVTNARLFALENFARDLLPVIDNLERAMDSANPDDATVNAIAEGVELTLKSFKEVLKKYHVEQVDPWSEPFDPEFHQAISIVENKEVEPNTVLNVVQKGYTLNGRLIRAAMVVVSK
jgi:molecular chaperone GrpE